MSDVTIRRYQPGDRDGFHRIAADTAFFGSPVEAYLEDRRLFNQAFYSYYTDVDSSHTWVAAFPGGIAGFITGSADTGLQQQQYRRQVLLGVISDVCKGRFRIGKKTLRFGLAMLTDSLLNPGQPVDLGCYPAHLHINLDQSARGHGLGRRLLQTFLEQLLAEQVAGVHLHTTSQNQAACRLYESCGFRLLHQETTGLWRGQIQEKVTRRVYGRILVQPGENS